MTITAEDIINLIPDCSVDNAIVTAILMDATTFVDAALADCTVMTDDEKEAVTKWVAAHMVVCGPYQQIKREQMGNDEAEVEYEAKTWKAEGLQSTMYGRMALLLDRCGLLSLIGKKQIKIHAVTSFE